MNDLSIIIPSKNESATISECVTRVAKICPGAEIVVVDSGLDDTKNMIEELKRTIPTLHYLLNVPDRGKGDAIHNGIHYSSKSIIVQIDADLQFLPEEIPQLLQPILDGKADMTLGSRFMKESKRLDGSLLRSGGNQLTSLWASLLYCQRITDALAGFKAWRRVVTESFQLTSHTYSYEVELFAKAIRKGWRVMDVPITTQPRAHGVSTVSVLSSGRNILKDTFRFRFFPKS